MSAITRRVATAAAALVTTATALLAVTGTAHATPVRPQEEAAPCGFYRYNDQVAWYNHCRTNFVEIKVEHFFGDDTFFCAHPGIQQVWGGDNTWGIVKAEYDGQDCPPYRY